MKNFEAYKENADKALDKLQRESMQLEIKLQKLNEEKRLIYKKLKCDRHNFDHGVCIRCNYDILDDGTKI